MAQVDFRYLTDLLTPRHATAVDDPTERNRLAGLVDTDTSEYIAGFISQTGRVLGESMKSGETVLHESDIILDADGGWEPGTPSRMWIVSEGTRREDVFDDAARVFLAHSLLTGAASQFCGWRERVVAIVPEEVGPKESKIIRTLADGGIEVVHTYTVLDAYGTYARWVTDLALEYGSGDEAIASDTPRPPGMARSVVSAWLMREAGEAQLQQARHSLKFGLAGYARVSGEELPIAELARSLYTDRANLTKVIKAAEKDARISGILDAIASGDTDRIMTTLRCA
ncbi:hypothetical protein GCE86_17870 [Micromonospora terminaliae]|uniref:Uncharacterized protein n=1 Tax=Micromonospora terminaliae TaxID=1914461 RepID=A0AAJ2ZGG9_9ACTN|nr:hypothetical protein [Micromonospora terminaliae]NES29295.1 hypothetical protein [Micromonospora terminaliae]QGL48721.1 hypothetical protein GCE86_17870 [Micromonospora terminaliae]